MLTSGGECCLKPTFPSVGQACRHSSCSCLARFRVDISEGRGLLSEQPHCQHCLQQQQQQKQNQKRFLPDLKDDTKSRRYFDYFFAGRRRCCF